MTVEKGPWASKTSSEAPSNTSPDNNSNVSGSSGLSYQDAGVDIEAGNELVRQIAPLAKSTSRPGADAGLGGFGGFFDLKAAGSLLPPMTALVPSYWWPMRLDATIQLVLISLPCVSTIWWFRVLSLCFFWIILPRAN